MVQSREWRSHLGTQNHGGIEDSRGSSAQALCEDAEVAARGALECVERSAPGVTVPSMTERVLHRRWIPGVALGLAVVLGLGGCSSDPSARTTLLDVMEMQEYLAWEDEEEGWEEDEELAEEDAVEEAETPEAAVSVADASAGSGASVPEAPTPQADAGASANLRKPPEQAAAAASSASAAASSAPTAASSAPAAASTAEPVEASEETTKVARVEDIFAAIERGVTLPPYYRAGDDFLRNTCGIDPGLLTEYIVAPSEDSSRVDLVALLRVKREDDVDGVVEKLEAYLEQLELETEEYNPDGYDLVISSWVRQDETFVDLVISEQVDDILTIIDDKLFEAYE